MLKHFPTTMSGGDTGGGDVQDPNLTIPLSIFDTVAYIFSCTGIFHIIQCAVYELLGKRCRPYEKNHYFASLCQRVGWLTTWAILPPTIYGNVLICLLWGK